MLSEGHDWRHQRRTIAPAIAPRVIPMLARHIGAVAEETVASLRSRSHAPLNLLQEMQFAALEVAGRSMFSLEMGAFGPEMRAMLGDYACAYRNCVYSTFCCRRRFRLRGTSRAGDFSAAGWR